MSANGLASPQNHLQEFRQKLPMAFLVNYSWIHLSGPLQSPPSLAWMKYEHCNDEYSTYDFAEVKEYLAAGNNESTMTEYKLISRNVLRNGSLDHTVLVNCRESFLMYGSKTNECVLSTTRGKIAHDWRGPKTIQQAANIF